MHFYNQTSPKNKIICKPIFRTFYFQNNHDFSKTELSEFAALNALNLIAQKGLDMILLIPNYKTN